MPRHHPLTRLGVLVIAAAALLWIGAEIAHRVEGILPAAAGAGAVLALVGLYLEAQRRKSALVAGAKTSARNRPGAAGVETSRGRTAGGRASRGAHERI